MPQKGKLYAYAWRSGLIEFGTEIPDGAIAIAHGLPGTVRRIVTGCARVAYDNKTLLVPGVPEARSGNAKVKALTAFTRWLARRESKTFHAHAKAA